MNPIGWHFMNRKQESAARFFLATRRSEATKEGYRRTLRVVLSGRPDAFLRLAEQQPLKAERVLIRFFTRRRKSTASSTLAGYLYCVRAFLGFNGVRLRWERIEQVLPPIRRRGEDRAPSLREIRKLLANSDHRLRAAALMMASSGMRVGAFWFPKASGGYGFMRVRDVSFRESGVAVVRVYSGEAEEYTAFVSEEASMALRRYWRLRRRRGERLGPWSPVLAVHRGHRFPKQMKFCRHRHGPVPSSMADPLTVDGIQSDFARGWEASGVLGSNSPLGFKACHGLRKRFQTEAKRAVGMRLGSWRGVDDRITSEDVELLLGHHSSYHRPSLERLEAVYLGLQPLLLIHRAGRSAKNWSSVHDNQDPVVLELKRELSMMTRKVDGLTSMLERFLATPTIHTQMPLTI
jgi:integrase